MSRPARPVRRGHIFLIGGDTINPGYESSPFQPAISLIVTLTPLGLLCHDGTASGETARTTDEKDARFSAGLTDQVALRRSSPPSSLMKSSRDLDSSRAVCPISRSTEHHRPQFRSTPIRKRCQWAAQ